MKKTLKETTLQFISKVALGTAKKEVNSACMCLGYQPKLPESVNKFKKHI